MSDYSDFDHFGLDLRLIEAVRAMGYRRPTPIQSKAIPIVLKGRDVMGAAQTGTGKTAGFALPILHRLLPHANASMSPARHPVRALILTPTRELADQVADNVRQYASHTALRSTVVFGGVDMDPQTQALRAGVEVLVATPGRLLDHLQQKNTSLGQVEVVVLDEADRMLDMGFLPDISRILNLLPRERQSLMFSATFSVEIRKLAAGFLREPVMVEVARPNVTADTVRQELLHVHESDKQSALLALLADPQLPQVLVFVNTKIGARRLARQLQREGVNADAIHGDKTQEERMKALEAFKSGGLKVLVATDVAARGLDISELPAVVNYDVPYAPEDYIHRIGRTGRAGAQGRAITIATGADDKAVAAIEKLLKRTIDRSRIEPRPVPRSRRRGGQDERQRRAPGAASAPASAPIDEFFLKPYEPAAPSAAQEPLPEPAATGKAAGKVRVPALLGGSRR
ncbi:MAG: DEAD/DEAH box helicase [Burkholderiaceae bacterium]|nr:DEAD/DEAH box helicase [Burkholderiaceae bacterium]